MRMARLIVHADAALTAVANDLLDRLDRSIEKVHLHAADREPAAANDPGSPTANLCDLRSGWLVDEAPYDITQAVNVEAGALAEVKADVSVRGRMRRAGRPLAAKHDGDDSRDSTDRGRHAV